jgi:hypothetical protein
MAVQLSFQAHTTKRRMIETSDRTYAIAV